MKRMTLALREKRRKENAAEKAKAMQKAKYAETREEDWPEGLRVRNKSYRFRRNVK